MARYAEGPPRNVPGYHAMLAMTTLLLAEHVPPEGRVLVLGAGGALELRVFAQAHPGWTFDGVDPAQEMLGLAAQTLGFLAPRACLHHGYIHDAPVGLFDAATCLLSLHFLSREERQDTLAEVRRRLRPGAPSVMAHFSFPQGEGERDPWLSRYAAFLVASGVEPQQAAKARVAVDARLHILTPGKDEAALRDAGFERVSLFYAGFAFQGWVATA